MSLSFIRRLALAAAAAAALSFAALPARAQSTAEDLLPEVDETIAADVQKLFERAERAYKKRDWLVAIAHYQKLRTRYSYNVPLASKAELRLGDIAFARERYGEARGYYKTFVRFHPTHEQADYAAFRVGLCAFREIPGDTFIQPPAIEREQTEVRTARSQMQSFLVEHPASEHVAEAKKILTQCEDRLAAHEMYVAKFYARRGKWRGTLMRAERLVADYPASTLAPEALVLAIRAHTALGHADQAQASFERLEELQPGDAWVSRGRAALPQKSP